MARHALSLDPIADIYGSPSFDTVGPLFQGLPRFLAGTKYKNITDANHTVWQDTYKTDLPAWAWFPQHPTAFDHLNQHVATRRQVMPTWLSTYPVEKQAKDWDPQAPLFVDIAGGIGHRCAEFRAKYPNLPGRVVLQDIQYTIDNALPTPSVERVVYNMFDPQPVQGKLQLASIPRSVR